MMLTPRTIAGLRRVGVWDAARDVHGVLSPPLCRVIHRWVSAAPPGALPQDLVLKHRFDGTPVWVDPTRIVGMVRTGEWARRDTPEPQHLAARFARWWRRGGGNKTVLRHLSRNVHGRFVVGGDWDRTVRPFEPRDSVLQLLAGVAPEQTTEYQRIARWITAGDLRWTRGCRTLEELDRYFDELVTCLESIRSRGYRTQQQLGNDGGDEIRVCIDRDGQLSVFGGGTHRLTVALALGLPEVPVTLKRVHATWVAAQRSRTGAPDVRTVIERSLEMMGPAEPAVRPTPSSDAHIRAGGAA